MLLLPLFADFDRRSPLSNSGVEIFLTASPYGRIGIDLFSGGRGPFSTVVGEREKVRSSEGWASKGSRRLVERST